MFAPSRINTMAALINHEAFISLCISGLQPKLIRKKFAVPFSGRLVCLCCFFERTGAKHGVCMLNANAPSSREVS